jgi:hypothetical protein
MAAARDGLRYVGWSGEGSGHSASGARSGPPLQQRIRSEFAAAIFLVQTGGASAGKDGRVHAKESATGNPAVLVEAGEPFKPLALPGASEAAPV